MMCVSHLYEYLRALLDGVTWSRLAPSCHRLFPVVSDPSIVLLQGQVPVHRCDSWPKLPSNSATSHRVEPRVLKMFLAMKWFSMDLQTWSEAERAKSCLGVHFAAGHASDTLASCWLQPRQWSIGGRLLHGPKVTQFRLFENWFDLVFKHASGIAWRNQAFGD